MGYGTGCQVKDFPVVTDSPGARDGGNFKGLNYLAQCWTLVKGVVGSMALSVKGIHVVWQHLLSYCLKKVSVQGSLKGVGIFKSGVKGGVGDCDCLR